MAPADILRVANVGDAQISPSGDAVVYAVSTIEGDATRSTLWLASTAVSGRAGMRTPPTETRTDFDQMRQPPTPLLPSGWYGTNPRWSPDGKNIAFLGDHESQKGIWIVTLDRRQPRFIVPVQETNFFITYAGEQLAWSPDSKIIAYVSASDDNANLEADRKNDPRIIDRIQYKSRTSFSDRLRTHVYFTYVDNPEPRQLTTGLYYDHALSFSPRGDEVAFVSNHEPDPDLNNNSDIFAVDLHGQVRQITNTKGCEYEPAWSPDGKWIAYTATKREVTTIDSVAEDRHVWLIDAAGGTGRELTAKLDRRTSGPKWSREDSIVFMAADHGHTYLYALAPETGTEPVYGILIGEVAAPERAGNINRGPFQVSGFSSASGARRLIAFTRSDPREGPEVWVGDSPNWTDFGRVGMLLTRSLQSRLTAHNRSLVDGVQPSQPEEFTYRSFDGTSIQGWLMKPVDWRPDRKYPLILSIHGGPHGMYGWAFNPTFQVYAARGYAVLYLNPRGSSGYGQKFSDGTLNEWGGGDYRDLMAGVDQALRRYIWIDQDRLGVTGGSYGGFMTNWIITQTPRFKAAVSVASVSNLISFYSTSLYQDLVHAEFGGFPWDNYDLLWQWSPLRYAKQVQTPTLFIHGEQDNDVHITQAEEMYMALKRRGLDSVLVRYPREGHGLREPQHRVDALERTLAWFDRYLK
jgi:dipeptidyl aminopeptidase/acylaminoacyl peptidase